MAEDNTMRCEIGAWVEGTTPKKNGAGMRKVWTVPAPKGEDVRIAVIAGNTHVVSLRIGTPEQRAMASAALALALANVPAEAPKAPVVRKAPTPPKAQPATTRNPAPSATVLANRAIAEQAARPLVGRTSSPAKAAPSGAGWFADLMAEAEGR